MPKNNIYHYEFIIINRELPLAVLKRLIGFFPSVTKNPLRFKAFNNLTFISGPD